MKKEILILLLLVNNMICFGQEKIFEQGFVSYELTYQINENEL